MSRLGFQVRLPLCHFLHAEHKAIPLPHHHDNVIIFHLMVRVSIGARRPGAQQPYNMLFACHQRLQQNYSFHLHHHALLVAHQSLKTTFQMIYHHI